MADTHAAHAYAKVNLGLVVRSRTADGFHPIVSLAQSIGWHDRLDLAPADSDEFVADGMEPSESNLAWRAVRAVRTRAGATRPVALHLSKQIPVAAGLGGGSADAATGLALAASLFGFQSDLTEAAAELGSDVPFCLTGGLALLGGRGERVTAQPARAGYALALVVPPVELSTPAVYGKWDALEEPVGQTVPDSDLPPTLREYTPLRNDLQPAAESLAPLVADWRHELAGRWGRSVLMSGSGPTLFAFFIDEDEAAAALTDRPDGARAVRAARPVSKGWERVPGTLTAPE